MGLARLMTGLQRFPTYSGFKLYMFLLVSVLHIISTVVLTFLLSDQVFSDSSRSSYMASLWSY